MPRIAAFTIAVICICAALSSRASAQACGSTNYTPLLMLVVDTSGSMELKPNCVCSSGASACTECMPNCSTGSYEKSRWAITLEALTGTWPTYQCATYTRNDPSFFTYDLAYNTPYHRPWVCPSDPSVSCPNPGGQNTDGIVDTYGHGISFGLMTFDSQGTWKGGLDQVTDTDFNETLSQGEKGLWSYGAQGAAIPNAPRDRGENVRDRYVGKLMFPGCPSPYRFDTGARNANALNAGALVAPLLDANTSQMDSNNILIQNSLLTARPFGGTPIAAALDDLIYFYKNFTPTDSLANCRARYALLITDGIPDDDWRKRSGCNCGTTEECCKIATGAPCTDSQYDPANFQCPYPKTEDVARALVCGYGPTCTGGAIKQLFVVGFALGGAQGDATRLLLDQIAFNGSYDGAPIRTALYAENLQQLTETLGVILNSLAQPPTTRTISAFGMSTGSTTARYEFVAGYQRHTDGNFSGILERKRSVCSGNVATTPDITDADRFQVVLNSPSHPERTIWTALPSSSYGPKEHLFRGSAGAPCGLDGCEQLAFNGQNISPEVLSVTTPAERDTVVNWVVGNSRPEGEKLSRIFHSSPVVQGPPRFDIADQNYNAFRVRPEVAQRPLVVYIATSDGVLHAFSAEEYGSGSTSHSGISLIAGQEIWGFIPPFLLAGGLKTAVDLPAANLLDGTAVVKDLFFSRRYDMTLSADTYHSILVIGLRGGGNGYVAFDVTDPLDCATSPPGDNCKFLWQFTDSDMGTVYGRPALAQALVIWEGTLTERAIAILTGGSTGSDPATPVPSLRDGGGSVFKSISQLGGSPDIFHRAQVQTWTGTGNPGTGRAVYIVDVETGKLIKKIGSTVFPSAVNGTPSVFQGDVGAIATRAFVTDADGVIWRIDLSRKDPVPNDPKAGWTARPFHDMYWYRAFNQGQASNEPPVISVDSQGRVVVIQGTGYVDEPDCEKMSDIHSVVSLTEEGDFSSATIDPESIHAAVNWEMRLETSEMITGPIELFDKKLLFSSYKKLPESSDQCDWGKSRLYALDYIQRDTGLPNSGGQTYEAKRINLGSPFNLASGAMDLQGKLFMGVSITQSLQCISLIPEPDPYSGLMRVPIPSGGEAPIIEIKTSTVGNPTGSSTKEQGESVGTTTLPLPTPAHGPRTPYSHGNACQ